MATVSQLLTRLGKLECRRNQHGEFQIIEQHHSEGQFNGECHFALVRNGMAVFRWPKKSSSIEEWESCFTLTNPGIKP